MGVREVNRPGVSASDIVSICLLIFPITYMLKRAGAYTFYAGVYTFYEILSHRMA